MGKGGQEWDGGGGKLRVISIWRIRNVKKNSEHTEREVRETEEGEASHCRKQKRTEAV